MEDTDGWSVSRYNNNDENQEHLSFPARNCLVLTASSIGRSQGMEVIPLEKMKVSKDKEAVFSRGQMTMMSLPDTGQVVSHLKTGLDPKRHQILKSPSA